MVVTRLSVPRLMIQVWRRWSRESWKDCQDRWVHSTLFICRPRCMFTLAEFALSTLSSCQNSQGRNFSCTCLGFLQHLSTNRTHPILREAKASWTTVTELIFVICQWVTNLWQTRDLARLCIPFPARLTFNSLCLSGQTNYFETNKQSTKLTLQRNHCHELFWLLILWNDLFFLVSILTHHSKV